MLINTGGLIRRGWTRTLINKHLGSPIRLPDGNKYYPLAKALEVENSIDLHDHFQRTAQMQLKYLKALEARHERRLQEEVEYKSLLIRAKQYIPVISPQYNMKHLLGRAIQWYNTRLDPKIRLRGVSWATQDSDDIFLERLVNNYIRHNLSDWDRVWPKFSNHEYAYGIVRSIIDAATVDYVERACKMSDAEEVEVAHHQAS